MNFHSLMMESIETVFIGRSQSKKREKRKISSSQSSQQQLHHHQPPPRSFWLHHGRFFQVPSHSKLAKWVTVASQVFNKRQEKWTRWVHTVCWKGLMYNIHFINLIFRIKITRNLNLASFTILNLGTFIWARKADVPSV